MNLLVLLPADVTAPGQARISGERARHIRDVLKLGVDDTLAIGELGGNTGRARIVAVDSEGYDLHYSVELPPPEKLPLTLLLALPRPKMLQRILRSCAELGVAELVLMQTARVEKSFWQSPSLAEGTMQRWMLDGLQQARDTVLPKLSVARNLNRLLDERGTSLTAHRTALIAQPGADRPCPVGLNTPLTLAIGPEGGFVTTEIERFQQAGFAPVDLGPRVLRVETAVTALIARLFTA